jgi:TRAP-type uncharacterized transport system substrate-binding protein
MRRFMPRRPVQLVLFLLALGLLVMLSTLIYRQFFVAPVLRVAVQEESADAALMASFSRALARQKKDVQLQLLPTGGVRQSGEALQQRRADLAVIRPDAFLPGNGLTVAILREEPVFLLTPGNSGIDDVEKLARKRIGLVSQHETDLRTLEAVLAHYDLMSGAVVPLTPEDVEPAFEGKRIDAIAFIAPPVDARADAIARAAGRGANGKVHVLEIKAAEALSVKNQGLTAVKIPAGSLSGRMLQPKEEIDTVGTSYRLVARADLDRAPVSKVAQYLFKLRTEIAQEAPAAGFMKAPDNDLATSERLPVHQGAIDYFNREQQTFMDVYGDWLWMLLFAAGGMTSGMAWLVQHFAHKRRELIDDVLNRLLCMLTEAREAKSLPEIEELSRELDNLVTHAIRHARWRTTSTRTMSALILAIDSTRAALVDCRHQVTEKAPTPAPEHSAPQIAAVQATARPR